MIRMLILKAVMLIFNPRSVGCPRRLAGHPCKKERCDHSEEALQRALREKGVL